MTTAPLCEARLALAAVAVSAVGFGCSSLLVGVLGGLAVAVLAPVLSRARATADVSRLRMHVRQRPAVIASDATTASAASGATPSGVVVVCVSGPLTFLSRGELLQRIEGPPWPRYVVLDISRVAFADDGGVSDIEDLIAFLSVRGSEVVIAGASQAMGDTLAKARVLPRLGLRTVAWTKDEAVAALAGKSPPLAHLSHAAGWH